MENKAFKLLFRKNKFKTFKPNTSSKGPKCFQFGKVTRQIYQNEKAKLGKSE